MATNLFLASLVVVLVLFSVAVLVDGQRTRDRARAAQCRAAAAEDQAEEARNAYYRYRAGAHQRRMSRRSDV